MFVYKSAAYGLWYDWTGTGIDNNELQFMFYGGAWRVCDSDFTPKINTWYHIAATYNKSKSRCNFYVDGNLKKINSHNQTINNGTVLRIGGWADNSRFKGFMDSVRIYEESLTSAQIEKIYVQGLEKHQNLATK